jgi:23S rRNA-/tRNA-specific pseudouridylate synthase
MPKKDIEIIYQDTDLVVINKPAGVSSTADRTGAADLLSILRKQLGAESKLRLIHRLDKFASGVMLLAQNRATQSRLSSLFEKRQVKKTYLALVAGTTGRPGGTIKTPLKGQAGCDAMAASGGFRCGRAAGCLADYRQDTSNPSALKKHTFATRYRLSVRLGQARNAVGF